MSVLFLSASLAGLYFLVSGPFPASSLGTGELLYVAMLAWSFVLGLMNLPTDRLLSGLRDRPSAEPFLALALLLSVFDYVFALNANMDYVQRFIESGGNLTLALDTRTERLVVLIRYGPLILAGVSSFLLRRFRDGAAQSLTEVCRSWGLPLTLASAALHALSFPSFLSLDGLPWLGWFALVPVFLVLRHSCYRRAVFLAVVFGTFTMILSNYWLGTFSLVSLQLTVVFFAVFYLLFALIALLPLSRMGWLGFFYLALAWTGFEYARSIGFLGYPWVLAGHSQYSAVGLIQLSAITGVWGVSALVFLVNGALAAAITGIDGRPSLRVARRSARRLIPVFGAGILVAAVYTGGTVHLARSGTAADAPETARIALVQQNSDPRKHDYERTFESLRRLTDRALADEPDLVAWSETAFVPNIRRWSREDPRRYRLARLALRFREYQNSIDTWLLTGNDDYRRVLDEEGEEVDRLNYNAAVLFSPAGNRIDTYHKVKLVPFTEYFPYRRRLPWVYDLLQEFDVHFWEPGSERLVFQHPKFRFATPICFEDVFPNHTRLFVRQGLDVIIALTNDYWSLSPVQAKQHFVASLFRAVENRRPMVRATASGLTGHIDADGRIVATLPYYEEAVTVAEVRINHTATTLYTRLGDWFPIGVIVFVVLAGAWTLLRHRR